VPETDPKRPHILSVEAIGLMTMAIVILILTILRYWHHIPWGAR